MMDLGYLQAAAQEAHKKRTSFREFEYGVYMKMKMYGDGRIERSCLGTRGHSLFAPSFKQKLQLILRVLCS